ncbi:hypothetical protein [Embleya sp. NPDC005575]|uniref:hypothetical protein n=1 Tax=Embleya sp. NPDC005575 TaxID=3156892 RepID=UPI0033BAAA3A
MTSTPRPVPGVVSGRVYARVRPRGFTPWNPRAATLELIAQVRAVLDEYRDHLPLTARQIFYALVGSGTIPKTENAYDRLIQHLGRARRAEMIPMSAIRDDRAEAWGPTGWDGPAHFWRSVRENAEDYRHALADGQPRATEVWVEAAGGLPMVGRLAAEYGSAAFSSGGFESVGAKHDAARRIADRELATVILLCGDHDPSGLSMIDAAAADVIAFLERMAPPAAPTFARIAVTSDQVARYDLITAPQKAADRRGEVMTETVQVEAMSPTQLVTEIRAGLEAVVDMAALERARARSTPSVARSSRNSTASVVPIPDMSNTPPREIPMTATTYDPDTLAEALLRYAEGSNTRRAAIGLLIEHDYWVRRISFHHPEWVRVDEGGNPWDLDWPALGKVLTASVTGSTSEIGVLALCSRSCREVTSSSQ